MCVWSESHDDTHWILNNTVQLQRAAIFEYQQEIGFDLGGKGASQSWNFLQLSSEMCQKCPKNFKEDFGMGAILSHGYAILETSNF